MNYSITHTFSFPVDVLEKAMLHPDLIPFLQSEMDSLDEMEVLECVDEGETIRRRIRYLPKPIIKRIGLKKVPPKAMEFVEHSVYHKTQQMLEYNNISTHPKVRSIFVNRGNITFAYSGNTTTRTIAGELHVKVKVLGMVAEKVIYKSAKSVLDDEAAALTKFITLKNLG
ncbi:DUF2505 family protein [Myxococcota bacterium]|nr:DUF2505 family protein [Myxococcota bacterium]MBU1535708.1 DUF2505 family protein [Myxococcota bacterium]